MSQQKQKEHKYIYESPDGGKTVYQRKMGDVSRVLHHEIPDMPYGLKKLKYISRPDTPFQRERDRQHREAELARGLFDKANSNKALRKALDRAILIYNMIKDDNTKNE